MDFAAALQIAITVIETLVKVEPVIVKGISDLTPFVTALVERFTGVPLTDEERTALEAKLDELHNQFQAPIPSEDQQ